MLWLGHILIYQFYCSQVLNRLGRLNDIVYNMFAVWLSLGMNSLLSIGFWLFVQ